MTFKMKKLETPKIPDAVSKLLVKLIAGQDAVMTNNNPELINVTVLMKFFCVLVQVCTPKAASLNGNFKLLFSFDFILSY